MKKTLNRLKRRFGKGSCHVFGVRTKPLNLKEAVSMKGGELNKKGGDGQKAGEKTACENKNPGDTSKDTASQCSPAYAEFARVVGDDITALTKGFEGCVSIFERMDQAVTARMGRLTQYVQGVPQGASWIQVETAAERVEALIRPLDELLVKLKDLKPLVEAIEKGESGRGA